MKIHFHLGSNVTTLSFPEGASAPVPHIGEHVRLADGKLYKVTGSLWDVSGKSGRDLEVQVWLDKAKVS